MGRRMTRRMNVYSFQWKECMVFCKSRIRWPLLAHPCVLEIPCVVVNYGLLLSKSKEYKRFKSAAERAKTELDEIGLRKNQLLNIQISDFVHPDGNMKHLEDATEKAQEAAILSLVKQDVDPHDTIHQLDEETHDKIYGVGFDPCYPDVHNSKDLMESTKKRLQLYAHQLETSLGRQLLPPKLAEVEVLAAEGTYHSEHSLSGSTKGFQEAIERFERDLFTLISNLTLTSSKHSLIGVKGRAGSTENTDWCPGRLEVTLIYHGKVENMLTGQVFYGTKTGDSFHQEKYRLLVYIDALIKGAFVVERMLLLKSSYLMICVLLKFYSEWKSGCNC